MANGKMSNDGSFNFLLFSDLHNHKDMNFNSTLAFERLIEFLGDNKENLPCNYIFLAGDIANKCDYTDTRKFIDKLRDAVPLPEYDTQRVFWAVGNHDIWSDKKSLEEVIDIGSDKKLRKEVIDRIRQAKNKPEAFEHEMKNEKSRMILTQTGMNEYLEAYRDVCGFDFPKSEIKKAHRFFPLDELNLFVLNTCLTACDGDDEKNLFLVENRLFPLFKQARPDLPTIVLGHHGNEFFSVAEQARLRDLFKKHVDMYLCGHLHHAAYSSFNRDPHEIHQITCGGGMIGGNAKLVFIHGKYEAGHLTVTPYSYAQDGNKDWDKDYRLDDNLREDNNVFLFTRLGKHKSAAENLLFEKSQKYYNRQINPGGRFAYVEELVDMLLPTTRKPFETTAVRERDNGGDHEPAEPKKVVDCVLDENEHVLFIGDGGMGKTMSLLCVWQHELVSTKEDRKLPIYIPLNEYNKEGTPKFIHNFVKAKYGIDLQNEAGDFKTVLLLDGFNEITRDNRSIISEINDLMNRDNTRVVLTSRYDFRNSHGFKGLRAYRLQPLAKTTVKEYLKRFQYDYNDEMYEVLQNPMMLTLYAEALNCRKQVDERKHILWKQIDERFPEQFPFIEEPRTVAEILQNYMTCQIGKLIVNADQNKIQQTSVALEYIAPYIAYRLESEGQFSISSEDLLNLIVEFFDASGKEAFDCARKNWAFAWRPCNVPDQRYSGDAQKSANKYLLLLTNTHHVFLAEEKKDKKGKKIIEYIFRHQHFRDFLSASYMKQVLEKHDYAKDTGLPAVLSSRPFATNIAKMLGECLGEHKNAQFLTRETELHKVVEAMRKRKASETGYVLNNIIKMWKEARQSQIIGEDLSGLDLSIVPMNGIRFSSVPDDGTISPDDKKTCFDGAALSANSLLPMGHNGMINSVVYSDDGERILTASYDNTIREWDRKNGECLRVFEHNGYALSAVYSKDGRRILSASADKTIREWDRETGKPLQFSVEYSASFYSAVYSKDKDEDKDKDKKEQWVLTASKDNTIREWNRENGNPREFTSGEKKGEPCVFTHDDSVLTAVYSKDGRRILSASFDSTIREWDQETGECLWTFKVESEVKGRNTRVNSAVYSNDEDERCVLLASYDHTIREWDRETGKPREFTSGEKAGEPCVYVDHRSGARSAVYSNDGLRILSASFDGTIREWDRETGKCLRVFEGHSFGARSAVYSKDKNERRVLSASDDNTIREWDRETGECLRVFEGQRFGVQRTAYSKDGRWVLSASDDNTIRERYRKTGKPRIIKTGEKKGKPCVYAGHTASVLIVMYSKDGKRVLSASSDYTIREWDRKTGKPREFTSGEKKGEQCVFEHKNWVLSLKYSKDGRRILSASSDSTICEWDRKTGVPRVVFKGHTSRVLSAVYSDDGLRVLSASGDKTIREWDRKNKTPRVFPAGKNAGKPCVYEGHSAGVYNAEYIDGGRRIRSYSDDDTTRVWDTETGECVDERPYYTGLHIKGCSFKGATFIGNKIEPAVREYGGILS